MAYLVRTIVGVLWAVATSTAVLAHAAVKPIELRDSTDYQSISFRVTTDNTTWYSRPIYARALRGISFADSVVYPW